MDENDRTTLAHADTCVPCHPLPWSSILQRGPVRESCFQIGRYLLGGAVHSDGSHLFERKTLLLLNVQFSSCPIPVACDLLLRKLYALSHRVSGNRCASSPPDSFFRSCTLGKGKGNDVDERCMTGGRFIRQGDGRLEGKDKRTVRLLQKRL